MTGREKPYHRRVFGLVETLTMLLLQDAVIKCYRTGEPITLENVHLAQKEHLVELALKRTNAEKRSIDKAEYCRVSLAAAHAVVTNGRPATTAGSSKHRIAKVKRADKAVCYRTLCTCEKVHKLDPRGICVAIAAAKAAGGSGPVVVKGDDGRDKYLWQPGRGLVFHERPKIRGPGFDKTRTKKMRTGKVVARKPRRKR